MTAGLSRLGQQVESQAAKYGLSEKPLTSHQLRLLASRAAIGEDRPVSLRLAGKFSEGHKVHCSGAALDKTLQWSCID